MITDFLVEHPWLAPSMLAVLVVAGPLAGSALSARPRLAWGLTGVSLLPVAAVTLVPGNREVFAKCTVQWALPTPGRVELFANVVLFVAPVLLAGVATRRPALAVLAGSALSAALEGLQAVVTSIGRSCDTNDWLCNTIGAVLGGLLAAVALRLARERRAYGQAGS
jgi:hypothetical protein